MSFGDIRPLEDLIPESLEMPPIREKRRPSDANIHMAFEEALTPPAAEFQILVE